MQARSRGPNSCGWFILVIIVVGLPFYLLSGHVDPKTVLIALAILGLGAAGISYSIRRPAGGAPTSDQRPQTTGFCQYCGAAHDAGARFCPTCGKPLGNQLS